MKIFSRGTDAPKPATPPVAAVAAAPNPKAPAPRAPPAPAPSTPPAHAEDATPPNPDLTAIIESNVKEMSEKIARLASTLEGDHSDRAEFESKIEQMEERMRKLSSLTEMISAQYNPFVGAAPTERDTMPAPEVGLSMPPLTITPSAAPPAAGALEPLAEAVPGPALDDLSSGAGSPIPEDVPVLVPDIREAATSAFAGEAQPNDVRLWSVRPSFGASMLMLNWADMLLKHVPSREGVQQMLEYYRNVGWLGEPARDQLLAYLDGLAQGPHDEAAPDWRASIEVHEKSLLFIEKLRVLRED